MISINTSNYKDVPAVEVDTGSFRALFLPGHGGKLASLTDRKTGREILAQNPGKKYRALGYAGKYTDAECSAFDDMFPTIDRYFYNLPPWEGIEVPDHGEVCGLAWQYEVKKNSLYMRVYSPRFGYTFEKQVSSKKGELSVDYRVTNNTAFQFECLYGAHCMIAAENGARIETEFSEGSQASLIFDTTEKPGHYGKPVIWDAACALRPPKSEKFARKIFFTEPAKAGKCRYVYADGSSITMRYSADKLPYLGIWFNWGSLNGLYNIAFEPCSGSYDRPDLARMHNQYRALEPYGVFEWSISFHRE
ncbi:MAG: hypothetical protein LBC62_02745 [Treponema sp.]|jgi:hypothetical protein|nr:hypothetical protein [Treponema sp.]